MSGALGSNSTGNQTDAAACRRAVRAGPALAVVVLMSMSLTLGLGSAWAQMSQVNQNPEPPFTIQNSPSIALDAVSGNIIVAYNDDPMMNPAQAIGVSYSPNGGANWVDCPALPSVWGFWDADPSVVSDQAGLVYAAMSSCDQFAPGQPGTAINSGVYVHISFDGGRTFPAMAPISAQSGMAPNIPWETKPKLEVDDFAASPYHLRVYSIWERDLPVPNPLQWQCSDARFAWSPQGGANWSAALPVNDGTPFDEVLWPDLAVGPDGSIAAAWLDSPVAIWPAQSLFCPSPQGQIWFDRSIDGGQTFGQDVPVITFWTVPTAMNDASGQTTRSAMSYPSVEIDPSNHNHVAIVYAGDPDTGPLPESRVDVGNQPPGSADVMLVNPLYGTSNLTSPCGAYAMAAWVDSRTSPREIYFNRASTSGGSLTWSNNDLLVSTQPPADKQDAGDASIVSIGGNSVYVIWAQQIAGSATHSIYFNASQYDGTPGTWLAAAIPLDHRGRTAWAPILTQDYLDVCASWIARGVDMTHADLCVNNSNNGGIVWQPTETVVRGGQWVLSHDMAQCGNTVHLVWEESSAGGSVIYYSRSLSDGAPPWSAPIRLDSSPAATVLFAPKVCCEGSNVYVTWVDSRNGTYEPYFAWSNNSGAPGSWSADVRINDRVPAGTSRNYYSQIACGGGNVYVVYESDRRQPGMPSEEIWINCSLGGGGNWIGEQRLDLGDPPTPQVGRHSCYPRLLVGGGIDVPPYVPYVFVVWMDDRNSPTPATGYDVYGNHSADGGVTWLPSDYRIDVGDPPGRNNSGSPQVGWAGGPYYLWRDERNGLGDVYANYFSVGPDEGDIFYIESFDAGQTWNYPPLRVNDDPRPSRADQSHPWIDFKPNGTADVIWFDNRMDPNDRLIETYFAALLPGAGAFTPNVAVTPLMSPVGIWNWTGDYNWIDVDATTAHIALTGSWSDPMNGDVFYTSAINPSVPQPQRACCLGEECAVLTEQDCAAAGGVWHSDQASCENPHHPDPCGGHLADHNVGACILSVTDQGILGFSDGTQTQGSGFIYPVERQGENRLYIGSIWVGNEPAYVANRDYDADHSDWLVSTVPDGQIWIQDDGWEQDFAASFTDSGAVQSRGLFVSQASRAFASDANAAMDDFVILGYSVANHSSTVLSDVYIGVFLDLDMGDIYDNVGAVDETANLVYMADDAQTPAVYVGLRLLQDGSGMPAVANLSLIDNETYVWPNQYILDADKFGFLSAAGPQYTVTDTSGIGPADYSIVASAGPFTLAAGETREVTFAIAGGESLDEMLQNSQVAQLVHEKGRSDAPLDPGSMSRAAVFLSCRPNPLDRSASIEFALSRSSEIELAVFDVAGRRVRQLADGSLPAGIHTTAWDGRDDSGRQVTSGVYFLRLSTNGGLHYRRVVVLR